MRRRSPLRADRPGHALRRRKKNIEEHLSEIRLRFENLVRPLSIAAA